MKFAWPLSAKIPLYVIGLLHTSFRITEFGVQSFPASIIGYGTQRCCALMMASNRSLVERLGLNRPGYFVF